MASTGEYSVKIPFEGYPGLCEKVQSTIHEFIAELKNRGYKIQYSDYSPYYSGHESTDTREDNSRYKLSKGSQEIGSLEVERTGSNFPTSNFPNDRSDYSVFVHGSIIAQNDDVLPDSLKSFFEALTSLLK